MKKYFLVLLCILCVGSALAQEDNLSRTRVVIGLSAPEILHAGINVNLSSSSQIGFAAGIGPSWEMAWPTISAEHRLYVGGINEFTNRRKWFFRQGATNFTAAEGPQNALTLSVGADLNSKARNRGWTIDVGAFLLIQSYNDRKNLLGPAVRFQYYYLFKKAS